MSAFLDRLQAEQTDWRMGRSVWITLAPLRYRSDRLNAEVVIPARFVTDFASVPRLPLAWLLAGGRGTRSAVLHDFPYQFGYWLTSEGERLTVKRGLVDDVFRESLPADPISGAGAVMAATMYAAVRIGGWPSWQARAARTPALNPKWSREGWVQEA